MMIGGVGENIRVDEFGEQQQRVFAPPGANNSRREVDFLFWQPGLLENAGFRILKRGSNGVYIRRIEGT
jgi:hypothetical protein